MTRARPYDRDAALDAALTLFWQKGYHATSLKDLESALHMKPGSIYAAFKSKEALFLLALERYYERNVQSIRAQMAERSSPLAALAAFLRSFAQEEADDPKRRACMVVRTMLDATDAEAALAVQSRLYLDQMTGEFQKIFEAAKQARELPDTADTARLARRFQANLTALRIEAQRGLPREDLVALADDMANEVTEMGKKKGAEHRSTPTH
ncbi:TetR/AcrR family transcriptional regulator [Antarctobacter jejuensis]|uniref:TetR/AcrR family transcriptional regulator n=1 Tax=Antarctobacter jejuensis TaxID=1439938 RepID=UPI003FCF769A